MCFSYLKKKKIGEGAYSTIFLAEQYKTEKKEKIINEPHGSFVKLVAIKQYKHNKEIKGIDLSAVREIKALKSIKSDYVINLHDTFRFDFSLNLVFDYFPFNLEHLIKNRNIIFMPADIKAWLIMILKGIKEIHKLTFIHRDIKPNNILFKDGILRIADLGLTRKITNDNMTTNVVTRWYRAPELLLGCKNYSYSVDVWSLGCIMAELYLRIPLFAGDSDISQLDLIFKALGTPDASYFTNINPSFPIKFKKYPKCDLKLLFTAMSDDGLSLLVRMLDLNPLMRPSVDEILMDSFFKNEPLPKNIENIIKNIPI